jgi:hypothetical protein
VLAVLLSRAGDEVAVSQLLDALWPNDPPRNHRVPHAGSRRRLTDLDDVHPLTLDVLTPPDTIALFTRVRAAEVNGYRLLGLMCCASGRYTDALGYLRRCLSLARAIGYRRGEWVRAHESLGRAFASIGGARWSSIADSACGMYRAGCRGLWEGSAILLLKFATFRS